MGKRHANIIILAAILIIVFVAKAMKKHRKNEKGLTSLSKQSKLTQTIGIKPGILAMKYITGSIISKFGRSPCADMAYPHAKVRGFMLTFFKKVAKK